MNFESLGDYMQISIENVANSFSNDIESFIGLMVASGVTQSEIQNILRLDLEASERIFNTLKNKSSLSIRNGIENASNVASRQTYEDAGIERFRWISAGKNVCPDCENRAGIIGVMEYFETIGLPKSGFSVCEGSCNCQLVPLEYEVEGNLIKESVSFNEKKGQFNSLSKTIEWAKSKGINKVIYEDLDSANIINKILSEKDILPKNIINSLEEFAKADMKTPDELLSKGVRGWYDFHTETLYTLPNKYNSRLKVPSSPNWFVTPNPGLKETFVHEYHHFLHHKKNPQLFKDLRHNMFYYKDRSFIEMVQREVGRLASNDPYEYVAEVGLGLHKGKVFNDDIMEFYHQLLNETNERNLRI